METCHRLKKDRRALKDFGGLKYFMFLLCRIASIPSY